MTRQRKLRHLFSVVDEFDIPKMIKSHYFLIIYSLMEKKF